MDRLLCGDVGFGKTEVALRAAFKCVDSGRQVMVLCPTTILAQQHLDVYKRQALCELPGVGPATAQGIRSFAFDLPGVYLDVYKRQAE